MKKGKQSRDKTLQYLINLSDDDILEAMKEIEGYIDITLSDFRELYKMACNHAVERLMQHLKAKDIMTKDVIFVTKDTSSAEIAAVMARHGIAGVPVVDDRGEIMGMISETDFLSHMTSQDAKSFMGLISECLDNRGCIAVPMREETAEDLMTSPAITVSEDTPVSQILNIFAERRINRVPVLNSEKKLTGIVSRADALRAPLPLIKG